MGLGRLYSYLAPGKITTFTGLWKSGKTTLITNLIKGLDGSVGSFAGQANKEASGATWIIR